MADRVYTYVDGESHFNRADCAWKSLHGEGASLNRLRYTDQPSDQLVLIVPEFKIFWSKRFSPGQQTFYFTAVWGDENKIQQAKTTIRRFDLEPHVVVERKQDAQQRQNLLDNNRVIEKPKGVDCALIVRVMEDAQRGLYDICNLFTSDVDYLPLIEAVKRYGKRVIVHGFKNGLGKNSDMEHVPNQFVDLNEILRTECQLLPEGS